MPAADKPEAAPATSPFATAFRGYDQQQVDERLKKLNLDLKSTAQNRDEAVASVAELSKSLRQAQQDLAESKAALGRLAANPSGATAMTERVRAMMNLAEEEIAELRAKAEKEAEQTRAAADSYAERTRDASDKLAAEKKVELENRRAELEAEFEARRKKLTAEHEELMANGRAEVDRLAQLAEQRRDKLDEEAAERRAAAEKKTEETLAAKTAEVEKAATEREADAKKRATAMITDAENQLADAEKQRTQAIALRRDVTERLTSTQTAMQEAMRQLGALEAGAAEDAAKRPGTPPASGGAAEPAAKSDKSDKANKPVPAK
ncbi:hypothetical protein SAMN05216266_104234 [Amycolatopsis marina]|uniref:DivIVA protein n=1 Tax=Amycolatopsis marina TaxID=490629 RepID=A0A1I0Y674_9PSEU|nr:hypothetical protein [Amycolatopsis marina]SFB08256.1 hypothetical protein SAMN05216266_104234 [Amycolatopsis marina]